MPVNSRRFGEPVPGLVIYVRRGAVAELRARPAPGVSAGFAPSSSAAAPATCGAAIEVPLIVLVAVSLVFQAEVMF